MLVVRPSTDSLLTWNKIGFAIWNRNYTKMGTNTKKKKWHVNLSESLFVYHFTKQLEQKFYMTHCKYIRCKNYTF